MQAKVPFYLHELGDEEIASVSAALRNPILTTGETVSRFEKALAEYLGCRDVVAVTSCTAALHMGLIAAGVGPGDEVITTPLTFVATAQAICYAGATPVFADVDPSTGNISAAEIEKKLTARTRAIMPVHLYGLMCDTAELKRRLPDGMAVIEDAAHCLEGIREGERPGSASAGACFSFFATKNLTCGEGGAFATNVPEIGKKVRLLRNHAMTKTAYDRFVSGYTHWDVEELGYKCNMSNVEASLLMPQMPRIEERWQKREKIVQYYFSRLESLRAAGRLAWPDSAPNAKHGRHLFTIWVEPSRRDQVMSQLHERGIPSVVNYRSLPRLSWIQRSFGVRPSDFPVADKIGSSTISLPFFPSMSFDQVDVVVAALNEVLA